MNPCIVMPLHDPLGQILPQIEHIDTDLRALFECAYVGITSATIELQGDSVERLRADAFYRLTITAEGANIGAQFLQLYQDTVSAVQPKMVLHLCFPDRLVFALRSPHRRAFITDIRELSLGESPLLFQRSAAAWATHPSNYREIEGMLTRASELLFGRPIELAWCHLAVQASSLGEALRQVTRTDLSMLGEIVLALMPWLETKHVDWLAWEDPLIADKDPEELRACRERSVGETRKRLLYVAPMLDLLARWG